MHKPAFALMLICMSLIMAERAEATFIYQNSITGTYDNLITFEEEYNYRTDPFYVPTGSPVVVDSAYYPALESASSDVGSPYYTPFDMTGGANKFAVTTDGNAITFSFVEPVSRFAIYYYDEDEFNLFKDNVPSLSVFGENGALIDNINYSPDGLTELFEDQYTNWFAWIGFDAGLDNVIKSFTITQFDYFEIFGDPYIGQFGLDNLYYHFSQQGPAPVPLPGTLWLMSSGLLGLWGMRKRIFGT